ncbi:LLM class F420-dependent oxidoreductase [Saccharothrix australiensis]|uniref:F420-dependent oxidoreductase-like protein n=1 Tax=Saccharothrix australiensis TaxID=2072 RepID=A0A495W335_9PSEU|nr:LLM class F420-dependent oxidoreductase [Saccharothrix australiensis]RKT55103.1 F420-dependent oxidoreductase-like protein [Saccharothrix australiensis]
MELAVHFADFSLPEAPGSLPGALADTARAAEEVGCAAFTVMDHHFQLDFLGGPAEPMLECYTVLGFLAGKTERITLGVLVTGVTYRHPGLLAKVVSTLDVLSGGRALLGLGAAWYEREHRGLGVPYPPVAERFERLEETLLICRQMWGDDDGPFEGRHYRLAETICEPRPLRRPPVLIGGGGERKTLRLVARHADACNLFGGPEEVAHKLDVLARHCAAEGRDPSTIEKTILFGEDPLDDPDAFLDQMARHAELGVSRVWVGARGPVPADWLRRVADVTGDRLRAL